MSDIEHQECADLLRISTQSLHEWLKEREGLESHEHYTVAVKDALRHLFGDDLLDYLARKGLVWAELQFLAGVGPRHLSDGVDLALTLLRPTRKPTPLASQRMGGINE